MSDTKSVQREIRRDADVLFERYLPTIPDEQGRTIIMMCSLVLAAYRQFRKRTDDHKLAFDAVQKAFGQTLARPLRWYVRLWLWLYRDPIEYLHSKSMAQAGRKKYGRSMEFADERSENSVDMLVTRCAFHQFFVDHGEPSLTLLVCAWDRNWMDVIDKSKRPARTERPSTLSTGGDCCRFRFIRDAAKPAKEAKDVVLVQLENFIDSDAQSTAADS